MADAKALIEEIKRELHAVEQEIRNHAYLDDLEAGSVRREDLRLFAGEQYHIIRSDLRGVALLVSRFGASPSGAFFQGVLAGEAAALDSCGAPLAAPTAASRFSSPESYTPKALPPPGRAPTGAGALRHRHADVP